MERETKCETCWKPKSHCLCKAIEPIAHRLKVIILQHPQEARKPEGTARLVSLSLPGTIHKVGLSWPSLKRLVGGEVSTDRWAVLYAGSLKEQSQLKDEPYLFFSPKGKPGSVKDLEGIVLLDGNWKQAKTLWWRNRWLKKLNRILLNPKAPSAYAPVRKQPRRSCLSTIEAVEKVLELLEGNSSGARQLASLFQQHLSHYQRGT